MPAALIPDNMDDASESSSSTFSPVCAVRRPHVSRPQSPQHAGSNGEEDCNACCILRDRERDGRCGACGLQTHELQFDPVAGQLVKIALSVDGQVLRGRCLLCHPITVLDDFKSMMTSPAVSATTSRCPPARTGSGQSRRVSQPLSDGPFRGDTHQMGTTNVGRTSGALSLHALCLLQGQTFDIVDILAAMKMLPHHRIVQQRGCERLWILSYDDETAVAIGRVGGIAVLLHAMTTFPLDENLQRNACESLQNLVSSHAANRQEVCDLGGVCMIVQAMMRHMSCRSLQQCGCVTLGTLAQSANLMHHVSAAGGFQAIMIAARHFERDVEVQRPARDALMQLGYVHLLMDTNGDGGGNGSLPRCLTPAEWQ